MGLKICATGDLMLLSDFPASYDYIKIADIIKQNDVRLTNLESVVSDWNCYASTFCGGQWINTEPDRMEDVKKFGFNIYSCANNHSMDYSFEGVLSTKKVLEQKGMPYAGIGLSLKEAAAPAYLSIPEKNIKVALISVTSTFIDAARAGDEKDGIPARPGVNPLRVQTKYKVSGIHYEQLKEIAKATFINGERDNARAIGSLPPEEEGSINFGGHFFVVDDREEGKITYCHKADLNRIIEGIKAAGTQADYVMVSIHSHQIKRASYTEPDYFCEEFAHKCIDAGACAVWGGGTHQLKPVEIYKGRPIFYSLGNFVFETHQVRKLPADFWDKYGYPDNLTVEEAMNRKTKNGTVGLEVDRDNYLSVIAQVEFERGKLVDVSLIPVELNFKGGQDLKGLPAVASETDTDSILKRLQEISEEYGTAFEKVDGVIKVIC